MNLALAAVQDQLEFYRASAAGGELASLLLDVSAELKMCEVSPEKLGKTAGRLPQGALSRKLREVSLILSAYDALVARSFLDPLDDLTRVLSLLREHRFFQNAFVAVDSFAAFTVQEYQILRVILEQSRETVVSLCTDSLHDEDGGTGLFSLVKDTARRLRTLARESGVPVSVPEVLAPGKRFHTSGLRLLEDNLYRTQRQTGEEQDCACIYRAANIYEEASFVSATIRRLVMEAGIPLC